jgi:hypothetical protein
MTEFNPALVTDARTHLLCYLVASALASYALTKSWRIDHMVESARIWLARNQKSTSWLERIMLGQLALKLAREQQAQTRAYADVGTLFNSELGLNYESPVVGRLWQRCSEALGRHGDFLGK